MEEYTLAKVSRLSNSTLLPSSFSAFFMIFHDMEVLFSILRHNITMTSKFLSSSLYVSFCWTTPPDDPADPVVGGSSVFSLLLWFCCFNALYNSQVVRPRNW